MECKQTGTDQQAMLQPVRSQAMQLTTGGKKMQGARTPLQELCVGGKPWRGQRIPQKM